MLSCTYNEYVLNLKMMSVTDRIMKFPPSASLKNWSFRRLIRIRYLAKNEYNDSIFIPIGAPYRNPIVASVVSHKNLKTTILFEQCSKVNNPPDEKCLFAPGDSIHLSFLILIDTNNNKDNEWLQKIPTKKLISDIEIKISKDSIADNINNIPDIIFNNDTNHVNINPVVKLRNKELKR